MRDALRHARRRVERQPAVAELDGAAHRAPAVAADPERRMRALHRARQHGVSGRAEMTPLEARDALAAPDPLHREDRFVAELVALGVVDAERRELGLEVARREAGEHAAAREHVEGRDRLRREEGVPVDATSTCVCTRSRVVAAATKESATNGSSAWWPPVRSQRSSGAGWSVTKAASKPQPLAARAISAIASALTNSSPCATRSVAAGGVKRTVRTIARHRGELRPFLAAAALANRPRDFARVGSHRGNCQRAAGPAGPARAEARHRAARGLLARAARARRARRASSSASSRCRSRSRSRSPRA